MKPGSFRYTAVSSVSEAVQTLADYGSEAKLLAGGQSLVPLMNLRFARPDVLVDLNPIKELAYVDEADGWLRIGAMTRHKEVAANELVHKHAPMLAAACSHIGYPSIRNRGTIGGSLAHADPAAELPCVALALEMEFVAVGSSGERQIRAEDFFLSMLTTSLEPVEVLTEVRVRSTDGPDYQWGFREFSRKRGDFALAMAAVIFEISDGAVRRPRISLGGVGDVAKRSETGEREIEALSLDEVNRGRVGEATAGGIEPLSDTNADSGFRKQLIQTLTNRAIADAMTRSGEHNG